jgi:hypothetical protein
MAVSLTGITVTLPSVGVSLTPTTLQLPWGAVSESLLLTVSIPGSTTGGSTSSSSPTHTLIFTGSSNSMYIPLMGGFG